jgi:cell division protein ZapA
MSQVTVTIAGRTYRIACADGEEQHLEGLARLLDSKVEEMRAAFGEIGDMRLHVMAAITIADRLADAERRLVALEDDIASLEALANAGSQRNADLERRLADGVGRAAERIERLARSLAGP